MAGELSSLVRATTIVDTDEVELTDVSVTSGTGAGAGGQSVKATLRQLRGGLNIWPVGRWMCAEPFDAVTAGVTFPLWAGGNRDGFSYFVPFAHGGVPVDKIGTTITTAGSAGTAKLRFGVWSWDSNGTFTLVHDTGQIAADALGACEATLSNLLLPRLCWFSATSQGSPAVGATIEGQNPPQYSRSAFLGFAGPSTGGHAGCSFVVQGHTGALPSSVTITDWPTAITPSSPAPSILVRRQA